MNHGPAELLVKYYSIFRAGLPISTSTQIPYWTYWSISRLIHASCIAECLQIKFQWSNTLIHIKTNLVWTVSVQITPKKNLGSVSEWYMQYVWQTLWISMFLVGTPSKKLPHTLDVKSNYFKMLLSQNTSKRFLGSVIDWYMQDVWQSAI